MHVLVGTDGSSATIGAVRRGIALQAGTKYVTLLTVLSAPSDVAGFSGSSPEEQEPLWQAEIERANTELAQTAEVLAAAGVDVERRVEVGSAATTICDIAHELGVDVVVVAADAHAHGALGRLLHGSVSEHVVRDARCTVVVVRDVKR
jgi:nucleotide-binding universal stress UspA family protein